MTDAAACLAAAVFLLFAVHRFSLARGDATDPAQLRVAGFALCMGAALLLDAPAVAGQVELLAPSTGLVLLVTHALKTAAFTCLVGTALALSPPDADLAAARRRRRRHLLLAGSVQAGSAVLLLSAGVRVHGGSVAAADGRGWVLALFNVLYAWYGCRSLLILVRALGRHTGRLAPSLLRAGLRLMMMAAGVGALWTLWVGQDVLADLTAGRQGFGTDPVSAALGGITALLATGGATATLWGDRLAAPVRWLRARRTYRALEPLWAELRDAVPEIALDPSGGGRGLRLRHWEFALYRRVIEIRDGHVALRPYLQPRAPAWAAEAATGYGERGAGPGAVPDIGLDAGPGFGLDAVVEAAVIAAALENQRAGRPAAEASAYAHPARTALLETVEEEAAWLVQVTRAFTRSRAVEAVRDRVRAQGPAAGAASPYPSPPTRRTPMPPAP